MHFSVAAVGEGALLCAFMVIVNARMYNTNQCLLLIDACLLIGIAIAHILVSDSLTSLLQLLAAKVAPVERADAVSAIAIWGVVVPLVVGGVGVNMLSTWITTSKAKS